MFQDIKHLLMIRRIRAASRPRAAFRRALGLRIASELVARGGHTAFVSVFAPRRMAVPLAVVLFFTLGTTTYAYTSGSVTDGYMLYPVRQAVEGAEVLVAVSPEAKTSVRLRQAERRLKEAARLLEKRPARAAATLRKIEAAMEKSSAQVLDVPAEKKMRVLQKIENEDVRITAQLEQFVNDHPRATRAVVRERIERSVDRLERQIEKTEDEEMRQHFAVRLERRQRLLERMTRPDPRD